jgi:cobalt-zinc-cadmium efflux system outer membrane protein
MKTPLGATPAPRKKRKLPPMNRLLRQIDWGALLGAIALLLTPSDAKAEQPSVGPSDAQLGESVDRRTVLRAALARNPTVNVSKQRAEAMRAAAKAEGGLPSPELMGEVWQIPLSRPAAVDARMIMLGITQSFPAPGSLSAKEQAMAAQAKEEEAMAGEKARLVVRETGRAFADYLEFSTKHRIQRQQLEVAQRLVAVAGARHSGGGSLIDLTRAQVELSRVEADVVTDATLAEGAKSRINALLARDPRAPLGPPAETEPLVPALDLAALMSKARESRPELKQAETQREAREHAAKAAELEATWPSFGVGVRYFPPTVAMPNHGYGASVSMSLPWLWGAAGRRKDAEHEFLRAARTNVEAARIPVDAEVVACEASARSAASRFQILHDRALPATHRSFDVARSGFESGRTDLMTVLDARRAVVEVERGIAVARADLDRAMTELEAAVGAEISLQPLPALDEKASDGVLHAP